MLKRVIYHWMIKAKKTKSLRFLDSVRVASDPRVGI